MAKENLKKSDILFNRELSWIEFNRKVLQEAADESNPLLERVKFLSIFSNNLDEFFMIRVSGLKRQISGGVDELTSDGLTAIQQRQRIYDLLCPMLKEEYEIFINKIIPELAVHDINFNKYNDLDSNEKDSIDKYFDDELFPVLTPIAIDNAHPFPNLTNRTIAIAIILEDPEAEVSDEIISVVQVPGNFPRFYRLKKRAGNNYILLDDIIKANAKKLFPGMEVSGMYAFRITRNADLELEEDEADDLLTLIQEEVKKRKHGIAIRLEVEDSIPDSFLSFLKYDLDLDDKDIYKVNGYLNLGDLYYLYRIDNNALKYDLFTPRITSVLRNEDDFFKAIKKNDVFLHLPFYSYSSIEELISQAAQDPRVFAIKLTLYRTNGNSPVIKSLIEAAENGKQVTAVVELKARFDEENNIIWARLLENAGVNVIYGVKGLKVHCKMVLIVRKEQNGMKKYLHLSTGNYNSQTARLYTDFGLITADDKFTSDASNLFNALTGYSKQTEFKKFLVAPFNLRKNILKLIDDEINSHKINNNGYIIFKLNSLVDEEIIYKLYEASNSGVKIDLIIRGICRLKPGITNLSENINVISIVGRFLEHSRVLYFCNNGEHIIYSGSADVMERNFDRRIEILYPFEDKSIKEDIKDILDIYLKDNIKARTLDKHGEYHYNHSSDNEPINSQEVFISKVKKKSLSEDKIKLKKKIKKFRKVIRNSKKGD